MTEQREETCALCGNIAHSIVASAPGYKEGLCYRIYECTGCGSSFAHPLEMQDDIYRLIYENSESVPGYNRYHRYAREVLKRRRPLDFLMQQEESYWAVGRHLRRKTAARDRLKVLEVGSGLGYFTYALVKDGLDAFGVDLSLEATVWAQKHYGPYFAASTMQELKARGNLYDIIIMNQIIEHLPDPHVFLSQAFCLLSKKGELIVTTPNKSAYPNSEWETDLPPVHLWWMTEEGLRALAHRHGCTVSLTDFTIFFASHYRPIAPAQPPVMQRQPFFDRNGKLQVSMPISNTSPVRVMLEQVGIAPVIRNVRALLFWTNRWQGPQGPVAAAVLAREGDQ